MFRPSTSCTIERVTEKMDIYGARQYAEPVAAACSILEDGTKINQTTVRVDSGASRGKASEKTGMVVLAFQSILGITYNDKITVLGETYSVDSSRPVVGRVGCVAYTRCVCSIWKSA